MTPEWARELVDGTDLLALKQAADDARIRFEEGCRKLEQLRAQCEECAAVCEGLARAYDHSVCEYDDAKQIVREATYELTR